MPATTPRPPSSEQVAAFDRNAWPRSIGIPGRNRRNPHIPVVTITTGRAGKRTYSLVKRYDRTDKGDRWRRLHQEDFCQSLGKPPSAKYESNHTGVVGPTLSDMFHLTRQHLSPTDIVHLLDIVVFNLLVCNTDAHAKNYSILIRGSGASLAPMYDVMCGDAWGSVTETFAQKIGGKGRGETLDASHRRRLAREFVLNPKQVFKRVGSLASSALKQTEAAVAEVAAMPADWHESVELARQAVERRAHSILAKLRSAGEKSADEVALRSTAAEAAGSGPSTVRL
jgi:serine/threonine-protein kinase HipA